MGELTKKEEMEDMKSARRAPPSAGVSFSQDRGRRCNSGNVPKGNIPGLVATSSSRLILLVYSDGRVKSSKSCLAHLSEAAFPAKDYWRYNIFLHSEIFTRKSEIDLLMTKLQSYCLLVAI